MAGELQSSKRSSNLINTRGSEKNSDNIDNKICTNDQKTSKKQMYKKDSTTFSTNPEDEIDVNIPEISSYTTTFQIRTAQLLQSKRYSRVLVYDGAGFTYCRHGERGKKVYMRCVKSDCKGKCNAELPLVDGSQLKVTQPHNHPADSSSPKVCEARRRTKGMTASEAISPTTVSQEECARLSNKKEEQIEYSKRTQTRNSRPKPAKIGEHSDNEDDNFDSDDEDYYPSNGKPRKRKASEAELKNNNHIDYGSESCPEEDSEDVDDPDNSLDNPDNSTSVPEVRTAQIVQGKRLSTQVVYDGVGFSYIRNKEKGDILYLRCVKSKCKGRCKTVLPLVDGSQLIATQRHNHRVDSVSPSVTEAKERMNERAATETTPMKTIFEEECARIPKDIAKQLKFSKVIKTMYRRRKNSQTKTDERSQAKADLVDNSACEEVCDVNDSSLFSDLPPSPIEQSTIDPNIIPLQYSEYNETSDNVGSSFVDFWICSNCGELFDQQSELEEHEIIHPPIILPGFL